MGGKIGGGVRLNHWEISDRKFVPFLECATTIWSRPKSYFVLYFRLLNLTWRARYRSHAFGLAACNLALLQRLVENGTCSDRVVVPRTVT